MEIIKKFAKRPLDSRWDSGLAKLIDFIPLKNITMIEIGCYQGESTKIFATHPNIKHVYAIDPWKNGYDEGDHASFECPMETVEKIFDDHTSDCSNITKIKSSSAESAHLFKDKVIDMVYIDGLHTYEGVRDDIKNFQPIIRKGGYLCGHDIDRKSIVKAITELLGPQQKTFSDNSWLYSI